MNKLMVGFCMAPLIASVLLAADAQQGGNTFDAFIKRDQAAFEQFRAGKPDVDRATGKLPQSRAISPERQRAQTIYSDYCRLRGMLGDPDPEKGMTPEERHAALKANEPLAWDGLRDALLSGDAKRIDQVLEALSPKPVITDFARAVAYWHGYQTALMEAATSPENSNIDVIATAYVQPELMALVRQGYADMRAGKPPQHTLPGADALQSRPSAR